MLGFILAGAAVLAIGTWLYRFNAFKAGQIDSASLIQALKGRR